MLAHTGWLMPPLLPCVTVVHEARECVSQSVSQLVSECWCPGVSSGSSGVGQVLQCFCAAPPLLSKALIKVTQVFEGAFMVLVTD